jgi:hypothetical protein
MVDGMAGEDSSKSKTPSRSKLPAKDLADALAIAQALKEYAVPASKAVIAGQREETTSSSHFKQKFASAGYYGLVEKDGDKFKLTDRGEAALDGDDIAKRTAVMSTGFGPIIGSLATRQVAINIIESRLKSDHGATESGAATLASVLVRSAEDAGLIVNEKFDAHAIESVDPEEIGPKAASSSSSASSSRTSRKSPSTQKKTAVVKDPKPNPGKPKPPTGEEAPIQVVVQVDGSNMEPVKIAELVKLLRNPN